MNDRYDRVYDVGLLDDLHNYFPGLLYEPDRFRTVSEVLTYIRQNTSRRFNLFDHGQRQYMRRNTIPQNTFSRSTPVVNRWAPPEPVEVDVSDIFLPLLRGLTTRGVSQGLAPQGPQEPLRRAIPANRFASLFEDIIVSASQDLIDGASNLRTLLLDLEESCSICQDRMLQGETIRRLNACQHEFHGGCVDNWFLHNSIACPVCRHDIRDPTEVRRSPRIQAAPNTTEIPPIENPDTTPQSPSVLRSRTN